ncbi:polysaccharide biosynthesis protein [Butyricicoccus sp. 1XD8-22]|nr:polysaccharide biosynthesis protein [Butyricicoccus sp. 1XD8-22]
MGKLKIPVVIMLGAILLKAIGNIILIPIMDVMGAAVASNIGLYSCAILLIIYTRKLISNPLAKKDYYIKLISASFAMIFVVLIGDRLLQKFIVFIDSSRIEAAIFGMGLIFIGAFVFLTVVGKLRLLAEKEWFLIPFGKRMAMYQLWLNKRK